MTDLNPVQIRISTEQEAALSHWAQESALVLKMVRARLGLMTDTGYLSRDFCLRDIDKTLEKYADIVVMGFAEGAQ